MAQHQQPRELAELKGADKKNPQRYTTTIPKSALPLGDPPVYMDEAGQACWFEISTLCIPGTMTGSDRFMLEIASNLLAEYRESPREFKAMKYTHLVGVLARFGLSPSDRNKLGVDKPDPKANTFAQLDD